MQISHFTMHNFTTFKRMLLLTSLALIFVAVLNISRHIYSLAVVEFALAIACLLCFFQFDKWINEKTIGRFSFAYSNALMMTLMYVTTVEGIDVTAYLWLSLVPFGAYMLNGLVWGVLLTGFYLTIASIILMLRLHISPEEADIESLFNIVGSVVTLWILTHSYTVANISSKKQLIELATLDSLTELKNRHAFYDSFEQNKQQAKSLVLIDLDFFKVINDTYGHDAGDYVLQKVAQVLAEKTSCGAGAFRLGGEEFAILLPNTNIEQANTIANSLISALRETVFVYQEQTIKVTASAGVANSSAGDTDLNKLMKQADECLYHAKQGGRDCVRGC